METREFEVRLAQGEERTITGIAVPYEQVIDLGGYREKFVRGAFGDISDVKLFAGHKEPIGKVTRGYDTDEGFVIEATISDTPRGNEYRTLLRDDVLNKMSVGFEDVESEERDGVTVRTKARLREVSIVAFPAYENASVLTVREADPTIKETPMENTSIDIEARGRLDDLERNIALIAERETPAPASVMPNYRSFGAFVSAVAQGDEDALALTRAFAGGVVGATVAAPDPITNNAWVSEVVRLVDLGRPTMNAFRRDGLPDEGMNIEWPQVKTDGIKVETQAAEADVLAFGKITLESKTSPVLTKGGYTAMSRQAIERSSFGYLDVVFRAMAIHYAKETNKQAVTDLLAVTGTSTANLIAAPKAADWLGLVADAAIAVYTNTGLGLDFILVSPDQYKRIAIAVDGSDRPLLATPNPVNNIGSANVAGLTASLGGLPVYMDPALPAKSLFLANREGFVTYESGGAPWRLADEDITNLTKEFSIYGYMADASPMPKAICKVTVA